MKKSLLIIVLILSSLISFSQSVLWKVTGKNIKEPSYLYGTIHIQDKRVFSFDENVTNAFNSAESFAMEVLMDEIPMEEMKDAMYMKKNTLKTLLSAEEYAIADSLVKEKLGIGLIMFNKMKPFFLMSSIAQINFAKDMDTALDLYLLAEARKQGKNCYEVEKFMDQINAVDAMSEQEQAEMLFTYLTDTTSSADKESNDLLAAYLSFDLESLSKMMQETDTSIKDFEKNFLTKRNKVMVTNFIKITKKQSCFCAIGAGHLSGKDGLIELLRKKGYTVEPVIFNWME